MDRETADLHPADRWALETRRSDLSLAVKLRLTAMIGHMRVDKVAARRAALIDLLSSGYGPYTREEIWETVAAQVGQDCWGKLPREALARDLSNLRKGGIRIAYSRRPEVTGYYLQFPALQTYPNWEEKTINWTLVDRIRDLPVAAKNERAFAAADFALKQKTLVLAEEHPDWPPERVEREARRIVFNVSPEMAA